MVVERASACNLGFSPGRARVLKHPLQAKACSTRSLPVEGVRADGADQLLPVRRGD